MSSRRTVRVVAPVVRAVVVVVASLFVACAVVQQAADDFGVAIDVGGDPPTVAGVYDGAACDGPDPHVTMNGRPAPLRKSYERSFDHAANGYVYLRRDGRTKDAMREHQVLEIVCYHPATRGGVAPRDSALVADHVGFDDRRFDHLQAALMVAECDVMGWCRADADRVALGMTSLYAQRVDAKKLAAAVEALQLAPDAKQAFLARYADAQQRVAAQAAALDPRRRELYVATPKKAMDARRAYFAKHADLYKKLDALLARSAALQDAGATDGAAADGKLVEEIVALRGAYVARAKGEAVRFDPFFTEATRELVVLHVLAGDELAALAEASLVEEEGADRYGYAASIYAAQVQALREERAAWEKYAALQRDGASPAVLKAKFGKHPPLQVDADVAWYARDGFASVSAALDRDGFTSAGGTVRALTPHANGVRVSFADEVTQYDDADCVETDKVDYIASDGRIVYRQVCKNHRTRTVRTKVDPVVVPRADAAGLRPGEIATMIVDRDSREGRVLTSSAARKLKQLRTHRVR